MRAHFTNRHIFILLWMGVYGFVCHQIGSSSSATRSCLIQTSHKLSSSPRQARITTGATRSELADESKLPYKCGLVFFYHVPSTGGSTINKWLLQYAPKQGGEVEYFTHWGFGGNAGIKRIQESFINGSEKSGKGGMKEFVQNIGPNEWRTAHCHYNSLHLNVSEHLLYDWRKTVEDQGCHFIGNVMFRESLSHSLSLYKHIERYNSTRELFWSKHLSTKSELGYVATQLDFFLYNNLVRNPHGVDKEEKVRRALELLQRHFDIVTVGNHERYRDALLKLTGWEDKKMVRHNTFSKELSYTKKEIEDLHKLLYENGDIDFIHEIKSRYKDHV